MAEETEETPKLSVSIAYKLLSESPLSAWANHRLLGNYRSVPTKSQIDGRMWHAAILEDSHDIVVVDAADFKTKVAKERRDEILEMGKIPVAAPKAEELEPAAERIREELFLYGINLQSDTSQVERRIEWTEYTEHGDPVECSGYIDHTDGVTIDDLKTGSKQVSLRDAQRLIGNSHSLLQDYAYRSAIRSIDDNDMNEFVYSFVQTQEPFSVTPVTLASDFKEVSRMRWLRAIEMWHKCLSRGTERQFWPGPVDVITPVPAPSWMISQEIEWEAMQDFDA